VSLRAESLPTSRFLAKGKGWLPNKKTTEPKMYCKRSTKETPHFLGGVLLNVL